jgi:leucyl-tRNA synthetase
MELTNQATKFEVIEPSDQLVISETIESIVILLSPITPHLCEHLWQTLGHSDVLVRAAWPDVRKEALVRNTLTIVVQVNGKLRSRIEVPADADKEEVLYLARQDSQVSKFLDGMVENKVIVVPHKLVNFVVTQA